jgi:hypothetical protein
MVVQPERRCLPIEIEPISLHREPRLRRPVRPRRRRLLARLAAIVKRAEPRGRAGSGR